MEKTWRWFGRKDAVTLDMMRQIGVEGVVTSLHEIPNGEIWQYEDIRRLQEQIASYGMVWSTVESLPVSESIKYGGPDRDKLIENYIKSLENLGKAGIHTVCYNFMPVIDWIRTDLSHPLGDGTSTLYFDLSRLAYFDIYVLGRENAEADFPEETVKAAEELSRTITRKEIDDLIDTIIVKTQGFINGNIDENDNDPVNKFKSLLALYKGISKEQLRLNLQYFLKRIMPVCDEYGINMCIHPDDPPMPVFGLPRIVCDKDDIEWLLGCVDNFHNGLTFCAGSLSAGGQNDIVPMAKCFVSRTHFVHLRSCDILCGGNFIEAPHTGGRADLVELVRIFEKEPRNIPMRVDHGRTMLGDENGGYNPGYSFHGRMLAFGQVEGIMAAVRNEINNNII
ncbi:MAG: mannonate dehydratase [Candidatus Cryptobacteroides sp.]